MTIGFEQAERASPVRQRSRREVATPDVEARGAASRATLAADRTYGRAALIDGQAALEAATAALLARDPERVGPMLEAAGLPPLRLREPGFAGLATIIVGQQVSTASADAINARLAAVLRPLTAEAVLAADEVTLRSVGLSGPKIRALQAAAVATARGALDFEALGSMTAEDAHRALVAVKGIGPWTADVFLLFCLGHPDAFPSGDVALQEGARLAFGLPSRPTPAELDALAEPWRPHRGVAARLLWAFYRLLRRGSSGVVGE